MRAVNSAGLLPCELGERNRLFRQWRSFVYVGAIQEPPLGYPRLLLQASGSGPVSLCSFSGERRVVSF